MKNTIDLSLNTINILFILFSASEIGRRPVEWLTFLICTMIVIISDQVYLRGMLIDNVRNGGERKFDFLILCFFITYIFIFIGNI
jgi:hypothetical protein